MVFCALVLQCCQSPSHSPAGKQSRLADAARPGLRMDQPRMFAEFHAAIRTREGDAAPAYAEGQVLRALQAAKQRRAKSGAAALGKHEALEFTERGPANVAGRTRVVVPLREDPLRVWLAGSVGGGVWKTTDAGLSWTHLTEGIPSLATSTIAVPASDESVIYVGTGEVFTTTGIIGSGMFKSVDGGSTWQLLESTTRIADFQNINRIIVDPDNPDYVIACGSRRPWSSREDPEPDERSGIYLSVDGGASWTRQFEAAGAVHQVIAHPDDFTIQYAAVSGKGVWKSVDAGHTWAFSGEGMLPLQRIELGISPTNPDYLYASVVGQESSIGADLYVSQDAGETWLLVLEAEDGRNIEFLGGQGGYNQCVAVHPYNEHIVYAGGVNLFQFDVGFTTEKRVDDFLSDGADFAALMEFGGSEGGGNLDLNEAYADRPFPVEIRFGPGERQLAHRFTVGNRGAGVPPGAYTYQDYVEVPFTVWDTEQNRQLMVSFRDQAGDGQWNLLTRQTDGEPLAQRREYLYIHDVDYDVLADARIARNGRDNAGQEYRQVYFFWPVLAEGAVFDPDALPASSLQIRVTEVPKAERVTTVLSDAYSEFHGRNNYSDPEWKSRRGGLHPDQHFLHALPVDQVAETFSLLVANDGGVYYSKISDAPAVEDDEAFIYAGWGLNTAQFYGVDKRPGLFEFIGGMQDNGSWYSKPKEVASAGASYVYAIEGDGFEAIWHPTDPNKIMVSAQFNSIMRTLDGGETWTSGGQNHGNWGAGLASFFTRLGANPQRPDWLYTIGKDGVWVSKDFGDDWQLTPLAEYHTNGLNNIVRVSLADPDVVWAGGGMMTESRMHVSTDAGASFTVVPNYEVTRLGAISGIATHPVQAETAYLLFSFAQGPKILKTDDLGRTWQDLSGYGAAAQSANGFPDVATYSLFVFPWDTDRLWAGTEIGIVESLDGGESWALLDSNLPATAIWQMQLVDDQLVIATHGRGIWTVAFSDEVMVAPTVIEAGPSALNLLSVKVAIAEDFDSVEVYADDQLAAVFEEVSQGYVTLETEQAVTNSMRIQLKGYVGETMLESQPVTSPMIPYLDVVNAYGSDLDHGPEDDYLLTGFMFRQPVEFDNPGLATWFPYNNDSTFIATLRKPVRVGAGAHTEMRYEDIAVIEPGEPGTVYGEPTFYEYVLVEASKNGLDWLPLVEGYDARYDPVWLDIWDRQDIAYPADYREHTIDLLDFFEEGDAIVVRFRFYSDANYSGMGYIVDNILIQTDEFEAAPTEPTEPTVTGLPDLTDDAFGLTVFPVPAPGTESITIEARLVAPGPATVRVLSLYGQELVAYPLSGQGAGDYSLGLPEDLPPGMYLVQLEQGDRRTSQKLLIE